MTPRATGGCDFLADPSQRADQGDVFWHPDENAAVVLLTAAASAVDTLTFAPNNWGEEIVRRDAADGTHIIIRGNAIHHQLWLVGKVEPGAPLTALLPMDVSAPHRAEAALRFWQRATYGRRRRPPDSSRRSDRLTPSLRALDGHLAGASYRAIADTIFDPKRVAADPWKTSPLRDRVIRLVRHGLSLMKGGYRSLLGPRRRD